MNYKDLVSHFSYDEVYFAYKDLCEIENYIKDLSEIKDMYRDYNGFSLDIIESTFHLYCGFNSTSYTGNTKEIILEKIKKIKPEFEKALKQFSN